ncbi:MAG TPA: PqqD family protein [Herpetosiphonaceae bacterium]
MSTETMGDGLGVFDPQRNQSYVLNATSALVFQHCDGQTTPPELAERLRQKFNLPRGQAEQLLTLTLDELHKNGLLQSGAVPTPPAVPMPARRQFVKALVGAGLALVLLPVVAPVTVQAAEADVFPTVQCVVNNGDGTYTAYFGYINTSSLPVVILVEPIFSKNMFTTNPKYRGQPTVFLPGTHNWVFSVVFDGSKITWMIKQDNAARQQVSADANSGCANPPPTTTVAPPTTTVAPPTTTVGPPPTTTVGPPPTTTVGPPPTTTVGPPPTTTVGPPPTTTVGPPPTATVPY